MPVYNGTVINESPTIVLEAGSKLENVQGKAVVITAGKAAIAGVGSMPIGIVPMSEDESVEAGSRLTVQIKDITAWVAGGKIVVGDPLTSDAQGRAIKATSGKFILGIALSACEEAGAIIRAQIAKAGHVPA